MKHGSSSYVATHAWLNRNHPKRHVCDECEAEGPTDYALIHGREYTRDRDDYRELCRGCHRIYDGPTQRRTHCKHDHEFTPATTYWRPDGHRECKTCRDARNKARFSVAA